MHLMSEAHQMRVEELRAALARRARVHPRLRPARPRNGAKYVAVKFTPEGPTGVLQIEREAASLLVLAPSDEVVDREFLDLRFDEGFCWDEILCSGAEELADLLLARAESLLDQRTE